MPGVLVALPAMLAVQVLVSLAGLAGAVLVPLAGPDLGVPAHYIGIYISIIYGMAAVSAVASSGCITRFGAMRVSQGCLLASALGLLLAASGSVWTLVPAALLLGASYGPATPASSHVLARVSPPRSINLIFSLKQTGVPLGNGLAGAILPGVGLLFGWQAAAIGCAVACVALAMVLQPLRPGFDRARNVRMPLISKAQLMAPFQLVWRSPVIRRLALGSIAYAGMQVTLGTFLVTYLHAGLGMPLVQAGLGLATAQAAGVGGRILWGVLADRSSRPQRLLGMIGVGMALAAVLTASFQPGWPLIVILAVCVGFGATAVGWNGVFLAEVSRLAPKGRTAEVTAGCSFFFFGGVMVAPSAFAVLLSATGSYGLGFCAIAVFSLMGGLALLRRGEDGGTAATSLP